MPTVAEALPKLQSMFDEMTAEPLTREKADDLISAVKRATDLPDGADLTPAIDPMFRLAEARETRAFEPLCRLLMAIRPGEYTSDADNVVTELLPGILAALYDGNGALLCDLVLAQECDEYVRSSGLCALVHLVRKGKIERSEAERVLLALPRTFPECDSIIWHSWTAAIATLQLYEFVPLVERTLSGTAIEDAMEILQQFREDIELSTTSVEPKIDNGPMQFLPFTTAAAARARTKELSEMFDQLAAVMAEARAKSANDRASKTVRRALGLQEYGITNVEPITNDYRNVGRNDPCPCGSGKKHKKCCLN